MPTSSIDSTTLSGNSHDQETLDVECQRLFGRAPVIRPGDTVSVSGTLPCGKHGKAEHGTVINAVVTKDGQNEVVLVATTTYGRRWFGPAAGPFKLLKLVARRV